MEFIPHPTAGTRRKLTTDQQRSEAHEDGQTVRNWPPSGVKVATFGRRAPGCSQTFVEGTADRAGSSVRDGTRVTFSRPTVRGTSARSGFGPELSYVAELATKMTLTGLFRMSRAHARSHRHAASAALRSPAFIG